MRKFIQLHQKIHLRVFNCMICGVLLHYSRDFLLLTRRLFKISNAIVIFMYSLHLNKNIFLICKTRQSSLCGWFQISFNDRVGRNRVSLKRLELSVILILHEQTCAVPRDGRVQDHVAVSDILCIYCALIYKVGKLLKVKT